MKTKAKMAAVAVAAAILIISSCGKEENTANAAAQSIKWLAFNQGAELAKKENKIVMVDFYADWCTWCKVLEKETLSDYTVNEKLKADFITVRIDVDSYDTVKFMGREMTARDFAVAMGVSSLPTVAFFESNGQAITKIPGFMKKEQFLPVLNYLADGCHEKSISFASYKTNPQVCKK